mmetsp:Transcript_48382/g.85185  ORF Transcript_48382/g.85185 Transcript_48382/m.85185 type:complete len:132 (+) Transcript_48382:30-425(+)
MAARRASLTTRSSEEDHEEPPAGRDDKAKIDQKEGGFNYKVTKLQTDMEMWLMDAVPELYGVDDSDMLPEHLQEDAAAEMVVRVCSASDMEVMRSTLTEWVADAPDAGKRDDFVGKAVSMCLKIQAAARKR